MQDEEQYLNLTDAAEYLGVSRVTVWRRVRDGTLRTYRASASRREKLVKRTDLDHIRHPEPIRREAYHVRRRKLTRQTATGKIGKLRRERGKQ